MFCALIVLLNDAFHLKQLKTLLKLYLGEANNSHEDSAAASLFIILKDHKDQEAIRLAVLSKSRAVKEAAKNQGFDMEYIYLKSFCKTVNVYLTKRTDSNVKELVISGLRSIRFTGLEYEIVSEEAESKNALII